jgi:hypothetical protein
MAVTLKNIHSWNPEKITKEVLAKAFTNAEQKTTLNDADILFAEGLMQKFKGLMLASMGLGKVTAEQFGRIMAAPITTLELEARRWHLRCTQVWVWLKRHVSRPVSS